MGQQLLPRAVAKRNRDQIRFHAVRAQRADQLADQDLGAAADKRRLAFEDEDPLHRYVRTRSSVTGTKVDIRSIQQISENQSNDGH